MASPISAQQKSAEESCQEFEKRMFNEVTLLESKGTFFFYKLVSKSMATKVVQRQFAYLLVYWQADEHFFSFFQENVCLI